MRFQKTIIFSLIFLNLAVAVISQIYPQAGTTDTRHLIAIKSAKDIVHFDPLDTDFEKDPQNETADVDQQLEDAVFN